MNLVLADIADDEKRRAEDIHDWLMGNYHLERYLGDADVRQGWPSWYSKLLSDLLLLTLDDNVEAAFSELDEQSWVLDVTVVSSRRIIRGTIPTRGTADDGQVRAISRRGVRDVQVDERGGGVITRSSRNPWPGAFTVIVDVVGMPSPLRLDPSLQASHFGRRPDMKALLTSFLADLDGRRR
ncbi:hypothetical protein ACI3KT_11645 [Microbacterium sp. ZW T6_19]|uniref:hypothetical protein n=1 Tax=Microbacterium sp. ZW T6_19 TaxID=3378082 RepID=UPI003851F757